MFDDIEAKVAKLKQALAEMAEHVEDQQAELPPGADTQFEQLQAQLAEVIDKNLPEAEKELANVRRMHAEAQRMHDDGARRHGQLQQALKKQQDLLNERKRPGVAEINFRKSELQEQTVHLDEASVYWWAVVALCSLEASEVIQLKREDRVAVALAMLWVIAARQTYHPGLDTALINRMEGANAKLLLCGLLFTGHKLKPQSARSPHALAAMAVQSMIRKGPGPKVIANYKQATALAHAMREGFYRWIDHSRPALTEQGFSKWLDVESADIKSEAMPNVTLDRRPEDPTLQWPLDLVDAALRGCLEEVASIDKDSKAPIDILALTFLKAKPAEAIAQPSLADSLKDWVYDSESRGRYPQCTRNTPIFRECRKRGFAFIVRAVKQRGRPNDKELRPAIEGGSPLLLGLLYLLL